MNKQITYEDLNIVYEDNHILVVVKPQNIPVQADVSTDIDMLTLLKEYLKVTYNKPGDAYLGLVHRLDRPTGGVMVFAKTTKAASRLCDSIKNGDFEKKYLCVLNGEPHDRNNKLVHYLKKNPTLNKVIVTPMLTEGAKRAELDYKVLCTEGKYCLVSVNLITGRTHQIRVQLATLGTPIFGDVKYGGNGENYKNFNLALWATEIKFTHPTTKEKMTFKVYPPKEEVPWKIFNIDIYLNVNIANN
ncbi:MAG: RluA family pseudouridine synthase [Clostridia bacterium]